MANSDNVLRGGLTSKHIDVPELMKHIRFEGITPRILTGEKRNDYEIVYQTPAPDFELSRFQLDDGQGASFFSPTADIVFVHKGSVTIMNEHSELTLRSGESAVIMKGTQVQIAGSEKTTVYRASVPE